MPAAACWRSAPSYVAAAEQEAAGQKGHPGLGREDAETCPGADGEIVRASSRLDG